MPRRDHKRQSLNHMAITNTVRIRTTMTDNAF